MFFLFSGIFTSSFVHKFSFDSRVNFGVMSSSKSSRNHSRGIALLGGRLRELHFFYLGRKIDRIVKSYRFLVVKETFCFQKVVKKQDVLVREGLFPRCFFNSGRYFFFKDDKDTM